MRILKPILSEIVYGARALGRYLGHEDAALMNGICTLIKKKRPQKTFLVPPST